jgi:hypothetical protein
MQSSLRDHVVEQDFSRKGAKRYRIEPVFFASLRLKKSSLQVVRRI